MKILSHTFVLCTLVLSANTASAHYPFVAPLSYQTLNNHTAIIAGFYDNPFASEVAIKNFKFHYHHPNGEKIAINEADWANTQTLSSYSLENKTDGTYRIRGEKYGNSVSYALDAKQWKTLIQAEPKADTSAHKNVIYLKDLKKNTPQKTVQNIDIIETFLSRRKISQPVIHHMHEGFDLQFLTHPNALTTSAPIQLKVLDDHQAVANLKVEVLAQTHNFSRAEQVVQTLMTDKDGLVSLNIKQQGQYLLKIDYQQPFEKKAENLKRYKYTLAFQVNAD